MFFKPQNKLFFLAIVTSGLMLQACKSLNPYVDRKSEISLEKAKAIQVNSTSRDAIFKEFGEPYVKGLKNGNEILIYVGSREGQNCSLEIKLSDKGLVSDYTFYEENPSKASK